MKRVLLIGATRGTMRISVSVLIARDFALDVAPALKRCLPQMTRSRRLGLFAAVPFLAVAGYLLMLGFVAKAPFAGLWAGAPFIAIATGLFVVAGQLFSGDRCR